MLSGFKRVWAQLSDDTLRTLGLFCQAHASAVVLHQMAEAHALVSGDDGEQVAFDFVRIELLGEAETLREPHDMGVDADCLAAERVAEKDIGGFPADPGQADEVLEIVGHFAAKPRD